MAASAIPAIRLIGAVACTLAFAAPASADPASPGWRKLSGPQIKAKLSGMQMTDEVHWRDVYERDGVLRSYAMGKARNGTWFVRLNEVCLVLPVPDDGCFTVSVSGPRVLMTPTGNGLTVEGILQPISERR